MFTVEIGQRGVMCVGFPAAQETFTGLFSMCPHMLVLLSMRPNGVWCHLSLCSHLLSTTQLGFTFLTLFLMFKSFSWPAPHISCLAVYSWWVWVLLWQRFLRSSTWHQAHVDYSNLPCYGLLLCSVIVTATKVAQHGFALPTSMSA